MTPYVADEPSSKKCPKRLYVCDEVSFPRMPERVSLWVMKSPFFSLKKSLELQLLLHSRCGVHAPSTERFLFWRLPQKRPHECLAIQKGDWHSFLAWSVVMLPHMRLFLKPSCHVPEENGFFLSLIVMPNACLHLTRSACVIAIQNARASNLLSLLDPMHGGQNCSRFSILSERSHYTRIHPLSHPSTRIIAKR